MAALQTDRLRDRTGDLSQVAAARPVRLQEGPEDGVRAIDVRVAGGLDCLVLADRGLDLGPAWHGGFPLAWVSPTGIAHPGLAEPGAWLRSFHGGLLVTCGLQNVGPECEDDGERHGLHGRASSIPASQVRWDLEDEAGELAVVVSGVIRETAVFGSDLVRRRRLRFPLGRPFVEVSDVVENRGFEPVPLLLLYHFNVGWPAVDEGARFLAPAGQVRPRDELAAAALEDHDRVDAPSAGAPPQVFEHVIAAGHERVRAAVVNEAFAPTGGIGVSVEYRPAQLPRLWQWRMNGRGTYLAGIEPANCGVEGRAAERARGDLDVLAPGERREFELTVGAHLGESAAELAAEARS